LPVDASNIAGHRSEVNKPIDEVSHHTMLILVIHWYHWSH